MTIKIVVMFATYILWSSFYYTAINIPYGSMSSAITEERAVLSTWRSMSANVASVIVNSFVPLFIYYTDANPWIFVSIAILATIETTAFNMLIWADIIDYQEVLTVKRDDATIYGMYSFSRKLGQTLAGGLGGFVLTYIGYNSAATQTVAVTEYIYNHNSIPSS